MNDKQTNQLFNNQVFNFAKYFEIAVCTHGVTRQVILKVYSNRLFGNMISGNSALTLKERLIQE